MIDLSVLHRLLRAFPNSLINGQLEFVADRNPRVNSYFRLGNAVHHQKTLEFIRSGYDMEVLKNV